MANYTVQQCNNWGARRPFECTQLLRIHSAAQVANPDPTMTLADYLPDVPTESIKITDEMMSDIQQQVEVVTITEPVSSEVLLEIIREAAVNGAPSDDEVIPPVQELTDDLPHDSLEPASSEPVSTAGIPWPAIIGFGLLLL